MANVIRHKRGTSNPAAGNFSNTAELLVNTSDGGLFTKTDGGSVVEIGANASNLSTGTVPSGRLSGSYGISVTGSSASCTGNAASATVLQTARTIGGVSFNGSANINLPGVNTAGNQNTSGNAASATVLQTARTIGGVSFNGSANINLPGVNTTGNQNTSGSSASCTGNAATASTLQTARTIALSGDVSGSASFNGSANITISATVADDSHNHVVSNIDGLQTTLNGKAALASAQTFTAAQRGTVSGLTSAATITPNFATANNFSVSLGTNTTIANPSNLTAGQSGAIVITYSGAYTVAFGSYWKFASGTAPTATSTSGKTDVLVYYVESSTRISAQLLLNMGG